MIKSKYLLCLVLPLLLSCGGKKGSSSSETSFSSSSESSSSESISSSESSLSESSSEYSSVSESESSSEQLSSSSESSLDSSSSSEDELWDHSQDNLRTGTKDIDFYNINDLHGAIEHTSSEPGISRISTYLATKRNNNPNGYVITSSGDMWQGSADSNITRGALIDTWMDYEGYAAMSLGNHEFDWKISQIIENRDNTATPFLASNIIYTESRDNVEWVKPYTTITRNGVHIGIIGCIGQGITNSILATNVKGLTFDNPLKYIKKHSTYLRENGADVILLLSHDSVFNLDYEVGSYVDAIFGGHNHRTERTLVNNTPAVQGQSNGKFVSHIGIRMNFSIMQANYTSYEYDNSGLMNMSPNPAVEAIRDQYADEINKIKNVKVANNPSYLSTGEGVPHTYNQYAYRYYYDNYGEEDIYAVVTNNGRAYIPSGVITYGDVYKALPFDNYLCLIYASGSHIKEICSYASSHWYIPSVSGGHISYDDANSYFKDNTYYYVLTIDYIAVGEYYASWMNIVTTFYEEEALPRNIVSHYLSIDYPI